MTSVTDFYTREQDNESIRVPLKKNGKNSGQWLEILGMDSDQYRRAEARRRRSIIRMRNESDKPMTDDEIDEQTLEIEAALTASLVTAWSFDEPCTPESVTEFMRNAPRIREAIDRLATDREQLIVKKSSNSSSSRSRKRIAPK